MKADGCGFLPARNSDWTLAFIFTIYHFQATWTVISISGENKHVLDGRANVVQQF